MSYLQRADLKPFAINVIVTEPRAIKTEWGGIAMDSAMQVSGDGPYVDVAKKLASTFGGGAARASDPSVIAKTIATAIAARNPKLRRAAGSGLRVILGARRVLSDRALDKLVAGAIG